MRINSRVEVIEWKRSGDEYIAQVAIDLPGWPKPKLSWPFNIYVSDWNEMSERQRDLYLERSATTLINRYGDAREIRIREDGQIVPRFGEAETAI